MLLATLWGVKKNVLRFCYRVHLTPAIVLLLRKWSSNAILVQCDPTLDAEPNFTAILNPEAVLQLFLVRF
jgi:hypothetical protein